MSLFSIGKKSERFGVIVDVGSGSAMAAIVHSSEADPSPTIVWYVREHSPLKNINAISESAKSVNSSLMNALLLLDSDGRKALNAYRPDAKISELQCTVSAPWSHTVTKKINYTQEEPFEITSELIEELERTAEEKTTTELNGDAELAKLDLKVVAKTTMALTANGYRTIKPEGEFSPTVSLTHGSVVVQQYLIDSIDDMRSKLFPSAESKIISYMLALYCVAKDLYPAAQETCLVDVTYEATEIGIVREGSLQYTDHISFGLFSLAREISEITKAPLVETFKYLHGDTPYAFLETITAGQKDDVETVFESYIDRLALLFKKTGDSLSIPKQLIVNTDAASEVLLKGLLEKAVKRAVKTNPVIYMVSKKLVIEKDNEDDTDPVDTAALIAARFFHKRQHCLTFEYS